MSAPDTNIEKQSNRHRPSMLGIFMALGFVAVLTVGAVFVFMGQNVGVQNDASSFEVQTPDG